MNQQISFWDVSKSSLGHLKESLDKMDELQYASSQLFRQFNSAQKVYLNSCKRLVNITQDQVIDRCQQFTQQRKEYQQTLQETANCVAETFYNFPSQKCYFSIAVAHGLFSRLTFPYMPNCINKYCKKQKNSSKQIFSVLLKYEQPQNFNINVIDQTVEIQNSHFTIILDYYQEIFYFNSFELTQKKLNEALTLIGSNFIKELCNKIAEQLPTIQKEEYFLQYLCYYVQNLIKFVQAQVTKTKFRSNQNCIIINARESIADFQNNRQTTITYQCSKKCTFQEIIIQSNKNFYIQLTPSQENLETIEISWNIDDDLYDLLFTIHQIEELKNDYSTKLRNKNRNHPTYFKVNFDVQTFSHEDPQIDQIFSITKCHNYFTHFPFIVAQDSTLSKLELFFENQNTYAQLPITYLDQIYLLNQFQKNLDSWDYFRWIIVRAAGLQVNKKLVNIQLTKDGNIKYTLKMGQQRVDSFLSQEGFNCKNINLSIEELFPSFEEPINFKKISKILEKKLIDAKFTLTQHQYQIQ